MAATTSINFNIGVKWDKQAITAIMGEIANVNALQNERLDALRKGDADEARRLAGGVALAQIALDKEVFRQRQALLKESIADAQDMGSMGFRETERAKLALQKLYAQQDKEEQIRVAKEIAEAEKELNSGVAAAKKKALIEANTDAQRPTPSVTGRGLQTFARSAASFGFKYESNQIREAAALVKLPEQIQAITFAFGELGQTFPQLAGGIAKLTTFIPIAAGAIGAALILWQHFSEVIKAGNDDIKAAQKELTDYYKVIATATEESLKPSKEKAQADNDAAQKVLADTKAQLDAAKKARDAFSITDTSGPTLFELAGRVKAAQFSFDNAQTEADKTAKALGDVLHEVVDPLVQARTALVQNQDAVDKYLDQKKQERDALGLSADEIKKRITSLTGERAEALQAIDTENQSATALGLLGDPKHVDRILKLGEAFNKADASMRILEQALPAVSFFENFAESFKSIPNTIKDFAKELSNLKKAASIRQDISDLDAKYAEDQRQTMIDDYRAREKAQRQDAIDAAKDREKYNDAVAKLASDSAKKQKDLFDKYNDDRLKRLQEYLLKEAEAIADYNKKRSRFVEDSNESLTELAAKGDVAGFVLAQRKAAKDLKRMDEDFADEQAKRKAAFDLKNKEADEQYQKELAAQVADDAAKLKQLQDEMQHRQTESERLTKELQDLERQWAEQDRRDKERLEKEHYEKEKADLIQKLAEQETLNSIYWMNVTNTATNALKSLQNMAADFTARIGALAPTPIGSVGYSGSGYGYGGGGGGGYIGGLQSNLSIGDIHIGAGNAVSKKDVEAALQDFSNHIARHLNGAGQ